MLPPEIASSWRRTSAGGLDPGAEVDHGDVGLVDPEARLLRAARPVLDGLGAALDGSRYTVLLADREARLVDARYGVSSLRPALERVGAVVGAVFTEATTGTNSIATAHELRRGVSVRGEEHYLESFKRFACYGVPILDPVTGRLAGVLDITCLSEDASALLRPFVVRGARDIEERLLGDVRRAHRSVLDAFETATLRTAEPVLAFGTDLVLSNDAATDLLQPVDQAAMHVLASGLSGPVGTTRRCELDLAAGFRASLRLSLVDGGVVVRVAAPEQAVPVPRGGRARPDAGVADWHAPLRAEIEQLRADGVSVVVGGEPGTGRRTIAARLATGPVTELDGATATAADVTGTGTVLVTDAHLLDPTAAAVLARLVEQHRTRLLLTVPDGEAAALAALCPVRLVLPTLRSRRDRIPAVATAMLAAATGGRARLTPQALRALAALDWPGNLRELRTVVDEVASRRSAGDVTGADLPAGYRDTGRPHVDGALWQAERDAVVAALRSCAGNKVHAAQLLGISRNTLYRRLRTLGIDRMHT